ncbi:MAG: O-antigen ligase family protein [Bacillota bacterium]
MTPEMVIKDSIIYRCLTALFHTVLRLASHSRTVRYFLNVPSYSTGRFINDSLAVRLASVPVRCLLRPVKAAGSLLRRSAPYSRALNLPLPAAVSHSRVLGAIGGIRVESALWLLISYPVVDYLIRNIPSLSSFAGSWDELLLLFIVLAWPVQMAVRGKITFRHTGLDIPILVYTGIAIFLFFMRSLDVSLALEGIRVYLEYMLWFFVGSNLLLNRRQFDALTRGAVAVGVLVSLVGIYQYVTGVQMPAEWVDQAEEGVTRVFSIVTSPNVLGSLLLFFIPLALARMLIAKNRQSRLAYLSALGVLLACMVMTYSRGAWLALAVSITVMGLLYSPRLIIAMGVGGLAGILFVPGISSRLSYMLSPAYMASSQRAGRIARWTLGLEKLTENPFLGTGFGNFGGAVAARRIPGSYYVDNFYLKTAVESGLIGLLALIWLLVGALRCGYDAFKKISDGSLKIMAAAILAGLTGVVTHNLVENIFEVPMMTTYFWLMAGILLSLPHIEE